MQSRREVGEVVLFTIHAVIMAFPLPLVLGPIGLENRSPRQGTASSNLAPSATIGDEAKITE